MEWINVETEAEFSNIETSGVIIVKFGAAYCGPCRLLAATMEQWKTDETLAGVKLYDVNVANSELRKVATEWGVRKIPTTFVLFNGDRVFNVTGNSPDSILEAVRTYLVPA